MKILTPINPDDALQKGWQWLKHNGESEDSRAGPVIVSPVPVTTVWYSPKKRVSLSPARDANPFFHLYEALWMLKGHNDAKMLDHYVSDFSSRFAEADGKQHGAYGHRWRHHFDTDQIENCVLRLRNEPNSRQVVLTMWDPLVDFDGSWKDRPCNTHIYFRRRGNQIDMTVCCRSNDMFWGAYGANIVHMSILMEYVCARVGCYMGTYYQVSNNFHLYKTMEDRVRSMSREFLNEGASTTLFSDRDVDDDITRIINRDYRGLRGLAFRTVVGPMFETYELRKTDPEKALYILRQEPQWDWFLAADGWISRRMK